jgi:Rne/Rng family ribonuclease
MWQRTLSMSNILVINASGQETRVALIEQGTISEYYLERKNEKGIVGNIYKGKVVRVLPGMQAAFVDIGLDKAAFLYVGDIVSDPNFPGFSDEMDEHAGATEGDPRDAADLPEPTEEGDAAALKALAEPAALAQNNEAAKGDAPAESASVDAKSDEPAAAPIEAASGEVPANAVVETAQPIVEARTESSSEHAAATHDSAASEAVFAAPAPDMVVVAVSAEVIDLNAEEALEDGDNAEGDDEGEEEGEDEEEEDMDAGDAAHAAAEAALAAEEAAASVPPPPGDDSAPAVADAAAAEPGADAPEQGQRGNPKDTAAQSAAREQRRGRRRGGRGRRRGNETPREGAAAPAEAKPAASEKREGSGGNNRERRPGGGNRERTSHGGTGEASPRSAGGHGGGGHGGHGGHNHSKRAQIQDLLKEGDEVLVQVVKDPIGTKGARITCHISLPGRHLVFMPTVDHVGISRRIEGDKERRRLRELVDKYRPEGTGFIVRTVAEGEPTEKLTADIKFLLGLWNEVGKKLESMRAPACIHPDLDLILRSIRDLLSADVNKVVIDDRSEYERVVGFVEQVAPELKGAIELYQGDEPIFDEFGIEHELVRASNRKVWLKSGGSIVIDQTEALVAIDVNSGRYTGKKSLEETITKINCEAAKEIVYQLRLRNIGGIIILDFIDMDKGQNRDKVFKTLQEALEKDRAKTNVLKISDIGLVEMTRKRVRESVGRLTNMPCPTCDGRGHVKSPDTLVYEIMREAQRAARKHREDQIIVNCSGEVAKLLQGPEREGLRMLMMRLNKSIVVRPQPQYHLEQFDLHGKWSRPELANGGRGGQVRRDGQGAAPGKEGGERGGRGGGRQGRGREQQERAPAADATVIAEAKEESKSPAEPSAS